MGKVTIDSVVSIEKATTLPIRTFAFVSNKHFYKK